MARQKKEIEEIVREEIKKTIMKYTLIILIIIVALTVLYFFSFGFLVTIRCDPVYIPIDNISNIETVSHFVCEKGFF